MRFVALANGHEGLLDELVEKLHDKIWDVGQFVTNVYDTFRNWTIGDVPNALWDLYKRKNGGDIQRFAADLGPWNREATLNWLFNKRPVGR